MKTYTVHERADCAPVLVKEAFAWGALLLGPVWLLAQRTWLAAAAAFVIFIAILAVPWPWRGVALIALMVLLGLIGRDLRRWSLARHGYALTAVVAAHDTDAAYLRFMDACK